MANRKVENKTDNAWPTGKWRTRQTMHGQQESGEQDRQLSTKQYTQNTKSC